MNTVLNRFATDGDVVGAHQILHEMRKDSSVQPDAVTYNTLLKLYIQVRDHQKVIETLEEMKANKILLGDVTKSLIIRFLSSKDDKSKNFSLEESVQVIIGSSNSSNDNSSPYTFANAIAASKCVKTSLRLLQEASRLQMADEAVFIATANICCENNAFDAAIRIIDSMIDRELPLNAHALTTIIKICFNQYSYHQNSSENSPFETLQRFLRLFQRRNSALLESEAICDKVIRSFLLIQQVEMAMAFHLEFFSNIRCKPQTLNHLFNELQAEVTRQVSSSAERETEVLFASQENDDSLGSMERLKVLSNMVFSLIDTYSDSLRTAHYNIALRLVGVIGNATQLNQLFNRMSQSPTKRLLNGEIVSGSGCKPGTFTIAEFVRSARKQNNSLLAMRTMKWGIENSVYIPLAVISDCMFLIYRQDIHLFYSHDNIGSILL